MRPQALDMLRQYILGTEDPAPVLDVLYIPAAHRAELYTRLDSLTELEQTHMGVSRAYYDLLTWLGTIVPASRGRSFDICTNDVLTPTLVVRRDTIVPKVGDDGVVSFVRFPEDQVHRLLELADAMASTHSHLDRYRFYQFVEQALPTLSDKFPPDKFDRQIITHPEYVGVIIREKSE